MLTVTVIGQPGLEKAIRALGQALDTTQILDEGAAVIYNRLRSRFLVETDPLGNKWPPSQAALRRARTGRGGGTLFDTGKLFRSIQLFAESPTSRSIGTNVTAPTGYNYPQVHQYGLYGFPQRQFLGFATEDLDMMRRVIMRRIAKAVTESAKTP